MASDLKGRISHLRDCDGLLVECCFCRNYAVEPVTLNCLHSCCRSCSESSSPGVQAMRSPSSLQCPVCNEATEQSALVINCLLHHSKQLSDLYFEEVNCSTCDALGVAAGFWCVDCSKALCDRCYQWHNRFSQRHRSAEIYVARTWSLSQLMPAAQCSTHKRKMEMQCFSCGRPICLVCFESCRAAKHDLYPLLHRKTRKHTLAMVGAIRTSVERLSHLVSGLHQKYQRVKSRLQRDLKVCGHKMLVRHNRSLHNSTVNAFDQSVGEVCVQLQRLWVVSSNVETRPAAHRYASLATALNVELVSASRAEILQVHRKRYFLKTTIKLWMSLTRTYLRQLLKSSQKNGEFTISGCVPLTSDIVLSACLGAAECKRAAPREPLHFSQDSIIFQSPVMCFDLAVTPDDHLLLAAGEHGLLMYSNRGLQLSSWRPTRQNDGHDDWVSCVAMMNDGRAVVGVYWAQIVVLLRRGSNEKGDIWLEDRHVTILSSPPGELDVYGELLVTTGSRRDERRVRGYVRGPQAQLFRMSSGKLLYTHNREYDIHRAVLTALCLVTSSCDRVNLNSGVTAYVVDAFSHAGEFLWRHEIHDEEPVIGVCAAETWRRLYVVVVTNNGSGSRVTAISGVDGKCQGEVMSSRTHGMQLPGPMVLARGQKRTIMAMLGWNETVRQYRAVSQYVAMNE